MISNNHNHAVHHARLNPVRGYFFMLALVCFWSPEPASAGSCCQAKPEPATAYSSESLFHLNSIWTNQAGGIDRISSRSGRLQVVGMFFASCSTVCPRLVSDMKQIEKAIPEEVRNKTGFLLISLDPERDNPATLRMFQSTMQLDPQHWTLWQGHPHDVRSIAAVLGIQFRKLPDGNIAHSAPIILLNERGEIVMRLESLSDPRDPLVQKIIDLSGIEHAD